MPLCSRWRIRADQATTVIHVQRGAGAIHFVGTKEPWLAPIARVLKVSTASIPERCLSWEH